MDTVIGNLADCMACERVVRVNLLKCRHVICNLCIFKQMLASISADQYPENFIICPIINCPNNKHPVDGYLRLTTMTEEDEAANFQVNRRLSDLKIKYQPHKLQFNCPTVGCPGWFTIANDIKKCNYCHKSICLFCVNFEHPQSFCHSPLPPATAICPKCRILVSKNCSMPIKVNCGRCGYQWFWCCDNYWQVSHLALYNCDSLYKLALDNYLKVNSNSLPIEVKTGIVNLITTALFDYPSHIVDRVLADLDVLNYDETLELLTVLNTRVINKVLLIDTYTTLKRCIGITKLPNNVIINRSVEPAIIISNQLPVQPAIIISNQPPMQLSSPIPKQPPMQLAKPAANLAQMQLSSPIAKQPPKPAATKSMSQSNLLYPQITKANVDAEIDRIKILITKLKQTKIVVDNLIDKSV